MHICFSVINTEHLQEYMKRHEPDGNEMKRNEPKNNNYCNENMLDNSDYHYITKIKIEEKKK